MPGDKRLTLENYVDKVLPIAAIVESIATKGRSPGTTAQKQQKFIEGRLKEERTADRETREAEERMREREEDARRGELRREVLRQQVETARRKAARAKKEEDRRRLKSEAYGGLDWREWFPGISDERTRMLQQFGRMEPERFEREMLSRIFGGYGLRVVP